VALALPPLPGGCSLQTPIMSGFGVSEVAVVISVCQMSAYAAYGAGFRLWVWPDTHALEMAIPTSVYVSMVNLWKLPVWQSPQDNINFFLGPARHIMDFARNACTGSATVTVGNAGFTYLA
jgi:hypothetical protein